MTEEIIIDDIDVSECERHCSDNLNNPNMCYSDMTETYSNCNPKEEQCYFYVTSIEKQLKRAEQKLKAIESVATDLLSLTNEYDNCYHKDECNKCDRVCQYRFVDNILQIVEGENDV